MSYQIFQSYPLLAQSKFDTSTFKGDGLCWAALVSGQIVALRYYSYDRSERNERINDLVALLGEDEGTHTHPTRLLNGTVRHGEFRPTLQLSHDL